MLVDVPILHEAAEDQPEPPTQACRRLAAIGIRMCPFMNYRNETNCNLAATRWCSNHPPLLPTKKLHFACQPSLFLSCCSLSLSLSLFLVVKAPPPPPPPPSNVPRERPRRRVFLEREPGLEVSDPCCVPAAPGPLHQGHVEGHLQLSADIRRILGLRTGCCLLVSSGNAKGRRSFEGGWGLHL